MKLLSSLFALIAVIFCLGCAAPMYSYTNVAKPAHIVNPIVVPVAIENTFSKEQVLDIMQSVEDWNYVMNGQIVLKVMPNMVDEAGGKLLMKKFDKTSLGFVVFGLEDDSEILKGEDMDGVLGFVDAAGGNRVVILLEHLGTRSLRVIVDHEVAHLFGAVHTPTLHTMEYPAYSSRSGDCIDKITALQIANHNGIDISLMNYCRTPNFE